VEPAAAIELAAITAMRVALKLAALQLASSQDVYSLHLP